MRDPKCQHKRTGIVTSGEPEPGVAHATTNVCDRPDCIADGIRWVNEATRSDRAFLISDFTRIVEDVTWVSSLGKVTQ